MKEANQCRWKKISNFGASKFFLLLMPLNLISIVFLLQIDIGVLPLFKSHLDAGRIQKINGLVSNLSQGILISTFFYYLLVYLPSKAKAIRIKSLIAPRLKTITQQMEISILYFVAQAKRQKMDIMSLPKDAFEAISGLTGSVMDFNYQVQYKDEVWTPFSTGTQTDIQYFEQLRKIITTKIDEILNLPHIVDEDEEIVDLLPKIRDSQLFKTLECYTKFPGKTLITPEFSSNLYDYYSYFVELKKLNIGSLAVRICPPKSSLA